MTKRPALIHKLRNHDKETTWAGVGLRKGVHKCSKEWHGVTVDIGYGSWSILFG
jgi:hypothetical protein